MDIFVVVEEHAADAGEGQFAFVAELLQLAVGDAQQFADFVGFEPAFGGAVLRS